MRSVPALAAALAVAGAASPAYATLNWSFTYSDPGNTASGTLATDLLSGGSYTVTGITGMFDGTTITGLAATGLGPFSSDNLLFPAPNFLDLGGLGFTLASGGPEVIYGAAGEGLSGVYFSYDVTSGFASDVGSFSATPAVPEPLSLGMFAAGLASLGLLRRKR